MEFTENQLAFRANAFPCNPLPFLNELYELVLLQGTDSIKSDQAKMLLLTIIQQSYGQLASIDTVSEFERLSIVANKDR